MNDKKVFMVMGMFVALLLSITLILGINNGNSDDSIANSIDYRSSVCTSVERDGEIISKECSPNLITNDGKDAVRDILGQGSSTAAFDYIALCNADTGCGAADAASSTLENEYTGGTGLGRAQGTFTSLGTGNWSIVKTFKATADNQLTNKTGLFNATSDGTLLAENTFSLVTLQTDDEVTINWTIWVE